MHEAKVEKLGQDLLRTYLNGPYRQRVSELIEKDLAAAGDLNQLHNLEKLISYLRQKNPPNQHLHRHIHTVKPLKPNYQ